MIRQVVHALAGVAWVVAAAALLWGAVRRPVVVTGPPGAGPGLAGGVASVSLALLLLTGVWNVTALEGGALDGDAGTLLTVKLGLAVASFAAVAAYRRAETHRPAVLWAGAAVGTGLAALLLGLVR